MKESVHMRERTKKQIKNKQHDVAALINDDVNVANDDFNLKSQIEIRKKNQQKLKLISKVYSEKKNLSERTREEEKVLFIPDQQSRF